MKKSLSILLLLVFFGVAGISLADDPIMTPDGYLGFPAFEFGLSGQSSGSSYTEHYSYTNYSNLGTYLGTNSFSSNNVFANVFYPVSPTFTLVAGGSVLVNASGTSSFTGTANNFTGSENGASVYTYPVNFSWFVSCRIYTK